MPDLFKPFHLSCVQNVQPVADEHVLYITVYFGFSLDNPDEVLTEQKYLETAMGHFPEGGFLDMGFPKRSPEVLIAGQSQAPQGTEVKAQDVSVTVGPVTKTFRVFGDRYWIKEPDGIKLRDAEPYEAMPLDAAHAYGGDTHALNPVGKGHAPDLVLDQFGYAALPNIEDPKQLILQHTDKPTPVLFGPLGHEHPLRKSKLGTVPADYLKTTFPAPPPGFDPAYYNMAPLDQRSSDELTGAELLRVTGMSAKNPVISSRLPGLRPRVFAIHDEKASTLSEVPLRLETVWIFGTAGMGGLYYRGAVNVQDNDASEIAALVVAAERLQDSPRPPDYYAEVYRLRTDPADGPLHTLNDTQLMPPLPEAELEAMEARSTAFSEKIAADFDKKMAFGFEKAIKDSGLPDMLLPEYNIPKAPKLILPDPADIAAGKVDLASLIKDLQNSVAASEANTAALKAAELAKFEAKGMPVPKDPTTRIMKAMEEKDPDLGSVFKSAIKGGGFDMPRSDLLRKTYENFAPKSAADTSQAVLTADEEAALSRVDEILAKIPGAGSQGDDELFEIARAKALALPEADPFYALKQQMEAIAAAPPQASDDPIVLSPDDALSGKAKPAEIDFDTLLKELESGTSDSVAAFKRANDSYAEMFPKSKGEDLPPMLAVAKARLSMPAAPPKVKSVNDLIKNMQESTNTDEEAFFEDISEEEKEILLRGDHERSYSPEAIYPLDDYSSSVRKRLGALVIKHLEIGESFARRDIAGADFEGAALGRLSLEGVLAEASNLSGCDIAGSDFQGAALAGANLSNANARGSNFSRAGLAKCLAVNTCFDECRFADRMLMASRMTGATFKEARFENIQFLDTDLSGVIFDNSEFVSCMFVNCDLSAASLKNTRFEKTMIVDSPATGSNWSGAEFDRQVMVNLKGQDSRWSNVVLNKSTFVGKTELQRSYFDGVAMHHSSFQGGNLEEICFKRANLKEAMLLDCNLRYGDFRLAKARRSVFSQSDIRRSDFFGADLMEARFDMCDASNTNFRNANLFSSDLMNTKLAAADLSQANLGHTAMELPSKYD